MPKYENTSEVTKNLYRYGTVGPGKTASTPKYVYPVDPAFIVIEHLPAPWKKLHAGVLPVSITSGLAEYSMIEIQNESGAIVSVKANSDTSNVLTIPDKQVRFIEQEREIDSLTVTGAGSSPVYVYGFRG